MLGLAPSAQAATTGAANNCVTWADERGEGSGGGSICNGNWGDGWVYDKKADGRCPFARFHMAGGGYVNSPHAGGQGNTTNFRDVVAHPGRMFNGSVTIEWFSC
jgi:hypothetical protein